MSESSPTLSIITACYNRADMIAAAIESTLAQNLPEFEHMIIDGGSTDGTLEVLRRYSHLRVICEPDQGPYDAWNKGIHLARGALVTFLNSDDRWTAGEFGRMVQTFLRSPALDGMIGGAGVYEVDANDEWALAQYRPANSLDELTSAPGGVYYQINAWVMRKAVFERTGGFDLRYRLSSDKEFQFRAKLRGVRCELYPHEVYQYRRHPHSMTFNKNVAAKIELQWDDLHVAKELIGESGLNEAERAGVRKWIRQTSRRIYRLNAEAGRYGKAGAALVQYVLNRLRYR